MPAGSLLRELRVRHGLTQAQLARHAKTTARQVGRIERGESSPSVRTLERLMRAMGEELRLDTTRRLDDPVLLQARADRAALTPAERVAQAIELSRVATTIAAQAQRRRRG